MSKQDKKPGRPAGAKTQHVPVEEAELTRCPKCGSTDRGPYFNVRSMAMDGLDESGQPYTHITWRRCLCSTCGQARDDKTHENRLEA